jgi:transcriptional regulator with XRE-family HTH domain
MSELGFCNYAEVARRLGVSRQAIQKRLQAAAQRGEISPETVERYRYNGTSLKKRFNTSLSQENFSFIKALADQLEVSPAYILHAAVNRYRMSLLDSVTLGPLARNPCDPTPPTSAP